MRAYQVGAPEDGSNRIGPLIGPAEGKLLGALTELHPGQSWMLEPEKLDEAGQLWSPGIRDGVQRGSEFHKVEYFGPVLGVMTAESLTEIARELNDIGGARPVTPEELELFRRGEVLTLPDRFETNNAMVGYLRYVSRFDHPYEWITTLPERYATATPATVTNAAALLHPEAMTWVVVGDLSKIEAGIRSLGLGAVEVWDAEGRRLR